MRPPALGYRLRAGIRAYGTSNVTTVKLQNQDSKLNARHSESQRDRWQDEYVHSLHIAALEHTVIEPCTLLDRKASEGLWIYFVRHLETPWICFASSHAQWRAPVSDPFQFAR